MTFMPNNNITLFISLRPNSRNDLDKYCDFKKIQINKYNGVSTLFINVLGKIIKFFKIYFTENTQKT